MGERVARRGATSAMIPTAITQTTAAIQRRKFLESCIPNLLW